MVKFNPSDVVKLLPHGEIFDVLTSKLTTVRVACAAMGFDTGCATLLYRDTPFNCSKLLGNPSSPSLTSDLKRCFDEE